MWFCFLIIGVANALSFHGKELVFVNETERRSLLDDARLRYVRSIAPPANTVAHEALGPGIYLVRGRVSEGSPGGIWHGYFKYDPNMTIAVPPLYPIFGVTVRTDAEDFQFDGCRTERDDRYRFRVSCDTDRLVDLAADERVLWISEIARIKMHSYESRRLFYGSITTTQYNASGIVVGISDTGVDQYHCSFYETPSALQCVNNLNRKKIVGMCNFPGLTDLLGADGSHGTATTFIAAGLPCLSELGVAPGAKVWFLDLGPPTAPGESEQLIVPLGFSDKIDASGTSVHSASWGPSESTGGYTDLDSMFDTMARAFPKRCHVRSAGNDGPYGLSGANSKSGLSVGACLSRPEAFPSSYSATQRAEDPDMYTHHSVAWFSSTGPTRDGRVVPQVCAPGLSVRAAYGFARPYAQHADWFSFSGTSASAPAIAGLIAGIQARFKSRNQGEYPTCALVEASLIAHAVKPTRVVRRSESILEAISGPDILMFGTPIPDFTRWLDLDGFQVSGIARVAICLENTDTEPWTIVLRWTDVPIAGGADVTIINDLDMVLVGETSGTLVSDDAVNTFEFVENWPPQNTRIVVSVFDGLSTAGVQPFAIHVKGKARVVQCASTILPYEYTACTDGSVTVDSWDGRTSCELRTCTSNSCGADCASTCHAPCTVEGGTGAFSDEQVCRPTSCDAEHYFVGATLCRCKPGTAKKCPDGSAANCVGGAFAVCIARVPSYYARVVGNDAAVVPLSAFAAFVVISSWLHN